MYTLHKYMFGLQRGFSSHLGQKRDSPLIPVLNKFLHSSSHKSKNQCSSRKRIYIYKCDDAVCMRASIYFNALAAMRGAEMGREMRSSAWIDTSKHFAGAVVTGAQCPPGSHPGSGMHLRKQPSSKKSETRTH